MNGKIRYRPDVDGLRAVAVLAVLFYHAGFTLFSGGFVGVDVFFVISGYLITKKISEKINSNEFSFIDFYERRIRRIFPALFTTIIFTLIIGAYILDAEAYKELGQSASMTAFSVSNIFFLNLTGYFDSPSTLKPLLHMWSLSVEEQFYIFLPLLLVLLFRFSRKNARTILGVIAGLSFIASVYTLKLDPSAAFFLTFGRVWELLFGGILALSMVPEISSQQRNCLSLTGIIFILASINIYSDETIFPGASALIPVIGSAMIIISGIEGKSWVGNFLSKKPFVLIGKISYSLYLWHWPFLVFMRIYLIREMTGLDLIIWLGITFLVSVLSWKWIETPFRSSYFLSKPRIFYLAGGIMTLTAITGLVIHYTNGMPIRFKNTQAIVADRSVWNAEWDTWIKCKPWDVNIPEELSPCSIGVKDQDPVFMLWGDSHAGSLYSSLNMAASNANVAGRYMWIATCPPLLGIDRETDRKGDCSEYNQLALEYIAENPSIRTIFLHARWPFYSNGNHYKLEGGDNVILVDMESQSGKAWTNAELLEMGLLRTVDALLAIDREVIIVESIPEIGYDVISSYWMAVRTGRDINELIAPTLADYRDRNADIIVMFDKIRELYPDVLFIDPSVKLCDQQICPVVQGDFPIYLDNNHLSTFGAYKIAEIFDYSIGDMPDS